MKRIVFIFLISLAVPLWGQEPTGAESRHMNILILNTLDEYIRTSSLSDRNDVRDFLHLFVDSDDPCVYNDLLGTVGYQQQVSPRQYAALVDSEKGSVLRTEISQIRKSGSFYREGGNWHRKITLRKYVMLIDASVYESPSGGVLFDSDQMYMNDPDFKLVLDLVYDEDSDRILIAGIDPQDKKPSMALDNSTFTVVVRPDNLYADHLTSEGNPLIFNEFGQAIINDGTLGIDDDDVVLRYNTLATSSRYTVVEPLFKKYHIRLKPRYSMTLNGAFHLKSDPMTVPFSFNSKAMEAGLDLGIVLSKSGLHSRFLLYLGAAFSRSSVDMSAGPVNYSYGSAYTVSYAIDQITESIAYQEYVFPLYFELERSLGSRVTMALDVGGKFYLNQNCSVASPFHVEGSVKLGGAAASPFQADFERFIAPASYGKQPYDVSAFGQLEVDVKIIPALYVFVAGGYEYGVLPAYTSSNEVFFREGSGSAPGIFPVVYAGGKHLAYHSFADCITFNRQSIFMSAGLKIKL